MAKKNKDKSIGHEKDKEFPLPVYKKEDDIYNREKEEPLEDADEVKRKSLGKKNFGPGDDLDIPGAELDDAEEIVGEEDEENNYYSLGGERHEDLEEDNDQ